MTTAHRPTWNPAQGGGQRYDGGVGSTSQQTSVHDIRAYTTLKTRKPGQNSAEELSEKDLRAELEQRERQHFEKINKDKALKEDATGISALEHDTGAPPPKRARITHIQPNALDEDSEDSDAEESDSDSDDDDDDTAALMAELEKIKRERAEDEARAQEQKAAEEDNVRRQELLHSNPLLQPRDNAPDFTVRRRWDDDVVFKNCAKQEDREQKPTFINDMLRSQYHRRFMDKFIK